MASVSAVDLQPRLAQLNAEYARALDDDRLEDWPTFFAESCLYVVTTAENHRQGHPAGVIYADSPGMLQDRVAALRQANVYERQTYRHLVGLPAVVDESAGLVRAETPFAEGMAIAGASPETMVRVSGGKVTLRPIAGTRKRGATQEEDEALEPMRYSLIAERRRFAPRGAQGGEDGARGTDTIDGAPVPGKSVGQLDRGARLRMNTPGGGGFGAPDPK